MLLLILLSQIIYSLAAFDYCTLCENGFHTMCLYPKDGPGPACLDYRKVTLAHYQKRYIVDIHNDIRNHVASGQETKGKLGNQPPAADMAQLEWNEELANIAQRWADQCIPVNASQQHDICKKTQRFNHVGQNILTAVTNGTDVPELAILILNWYKQVVDVIPSDIEYFEGIKRGKFLIGQYTQLVWASTKVVGCGMAIYRDSPRGFYNQRLVCNYGPGGNVVGQPVYKQGRPCSKCINSRCDTFRKNLCMSSTLPRSSPSSSNFGFFANFDQLTGQKGAPLCVLSPDFGEMHLTECKNLQNDADPPTDVNVSSTEEYNFNKLRSVVKDVEYNSSYNQPHFSTTINSQYVSDTELDIHTINQFEDKHLKQDIYIYEKRNIEPITVMENEKDILEEEEKIEDLRTEIWIVPDDTVRLKRAVGKWYNGECRCDQIYRSKSFILLPINYLMVFCLIALFYN